MIRLKRAEGRERERGVREGGGVITSGFNVGLERGERGISPKGSS